MPSRLTTNDANVLEKIKDPESGTPQVMIDSSLPADPNLDDGTYIAAAEAEKKVIKDVLVLERKRAFWMTKHQGGIFVDSKSPTKEERAFRTEMQAKLMVIMMRLDKLVETYPNYASARNNRVATLRSIYGDGMLVKLGAEKISTSPNGTKAFSFISDGLPSFEAPASSDEVYDATLIRISRKVLGDLAEGIELLTPKQPFAAVSPLHASRLSRLYMHRGALYRYAARKLEQNGTVREDTVTINGERIPGSVQILAKFRASVGQRENNWTSDDFLTHASKDFMMAGRYGDKLGSELAIFINPTAQLCGQIVNEAMRKEHAIGKAAEKLEQPREIRTRSSSPSRSKGLSRKPTLRRSKLNLVENANIQLAGELVHMAKDNENSTIAVGKVSAGAALQDVEMTL